MEIEKEIIKLKRSRRTDVLFWIILLGIIFNFSVILFNNCRMPVYFPLYNSPNNLDTNTYVEFNNNNEVKYPFLADRFDIWKFKFSLGDLLIVFGFVFVIGNLILNSLLDKKGGGKNGTFIYGK